MNIPDLRLDRLRMAIRHNRVSFPSQVPVFARQPQPDVQWRLVELFFVHNWSCRDLAPRYGLSVGCVVNLIARWVRHAVTLHYLQEIPAIALDPTIEEMHGGRRRRG